VKIVVDMSLSPAWVDYLSRNAFDAEHWSDVGDPKAVDAIILEYARQNQFVVFTHDLDFGTLLALTRAVGPSVIQVRSEDPVPDVVGEMIITALNRYADHLRRGALITIEPDRLRARILPMVPG
jgi:predicted nuclease of predicted toxin-antitoxin system